jgi:hypothetical protein
VQEAQQLFDVSCTKVHVVNQLTEPAKGVKARLLRLVWMFAIMDFSWLLLLLLLLLLPLCRRHNSCSNRLLWALTFSRATNN